MGGSSIVKKKKRVPKKATQTGLETFSTAARRAEKGGSRGLQVGRAGWLIAQEAG